MDICGLTEKSDWTVFPNPTNRQFIVLLPFDKATITITDMQNHLVLKQDVTQEIISLQLENSGMYNIYMTSEKGVDSKKLLVQR
ncbi:MAG: T9SS type A sorting domain-containing protein [Saprospiraceae bacterium]|nr:T9SS type A sorting domain-containing protein [Saprospiraceae bacterium]